MSGTRGAIALQGIRAIIIDLDGTLVDTAGEIATALNLTLAELERAPLPRKDVEALIGRGVRSLMERALRMGRGAEADLLHAVERFERHYAATVGTEAVLYAGVLDGLRAMEDAGLALGVVTNKPRFFTEQLLARLEIHDFFGVVVAGDDGIPKKPAGDMLLAAARELGVDIDSTLMLGDSENDVLAAREAGCPVWCVPYGYNEGKPPQALACDRLVASLKEAADVLAAKAA